MADSSSHSGTRSDVYAADDQRWSSWMKDAQQGDKRAYERLLTEIAVTIRNYLRIQFGPSEFLDDITQECLLSIHKGRDTYDATRPFRAWMFAIVRHRCIDFLRKQNNDHISDYRDIDANSQSQSGANRLAAVTDASLILSSLSRQHRDVIISMKYLGYTAQETGEQMGISAATVRVRLHRALRQTRRMLNIEDSEAQ